MKKKKKRNENKERKSLPQSVYLGRETLVSHPFYVKQRLLASNLTFGWYQDYKASGNLRGRRLKSLELSCEA